MMQTSQVRLNKEVAGFCSKQRLYLLPIFQQARRAGCPNGTIVEQMNRLITGILARTDSHASSHLSSYLVGIFTAAEGRHSVELIVDLLLDVAGSLKEDAHHGFYQIKALLGQEYLTLEQISHVFKLSAVGPFDKYWLHGLPETLASARTAGFNNDQIMALFDKITAEKHHSLAFYFNFINLELQAAAKEGELDPVQLGKKIFDLISNASQHPGGTGLLLGYHLI